MAIGRNFFDFFLLQIIHNGSIGENEWFKSKFGTPDLGLGTLGPRLSHFSMISENEVLVDFFNFGWLDMLDIADSCSTKCT